MDIQEGTRAKRPPEGALDAHQQQKPRRSRAKGQGKGKDTDHQDGNLGHHQQLQAVARLLLRHDAQLNRLAQDTTVFCTFTNKPLQPEAILPHLYQISAEWKKRMESSQKPSMSLRVTIFQALLLAGAGSQHAPQPSHGTPQGLGGRVHGGRQPSAIPGQSAAGRGTDGPSADVYYGARLEEPRADQALPRHAGHSGGGCTADGGLAHTHAEDATIQTRRAGCKPDQARVLRLVLVNPHQICYANAVLLAWLWLTVSDSGDFRDFAGALSLAMTSLPEARIFVYFPALQVWKHVLRRWQRPTAQHDAHEFWGYLAMQANAPAFRGRWEARTLLPGALSGRPYIALVGSSCFPPGSLAVLVFAACQTCHDESAPSFMPAFASVPPGERSEQKLCTAAYGRRGGCTRTVLYWHPASCLGTVCSHGRRYASWGVP